MPSWSADGRYVYFGSDRVGNIRIWRRPVGGGNAIPVTTRTGDQAFESPDGKTVYFIPPSSEPGIYQMPTAGGLETLVSGTGDYFVDRHWAIRREGIYFAQLDKSPREIVFYRFASGKIEPVSQLKKSLFADNPRLAFNPSTGRLIYAQQDEENSSIMVARQRIHSWNAAAIESALAKPTSCSPISRQMSFGDLAFLFCAGPSNADFRPLSSLGSLGCSKWPPSGGHR